MALPCLPPALPPLPGPALPLPLQAETHCRMQKACSILPCLAPPSCTPAAPPLLGPALLPPCLQAETYRRMKKATKNHWQAHVPATNVYWMLYLVDICMTEVRGVHVTRGAGQAGVGYSWCYMQRLVEICRTEVGVRQYMRFRQGGRTTPGGTACSGEAVPGGPSA